MTSYPVIRKIPSDLNYKPIVSHPVDHLESGGGGGVGGGNLSFFYTFCMIVYGTQVLLGFFNFAISAASSGVKPLNPRFSTFAQQLVLCPQRHLFRRTNQFDSKLLLPPLPPPTWSLFFFLKLIVVISRFACHHHHIRSQTVPVDYTILRFCRT